MGLLDAALLISILLFFAILIWSKWQQQQVIETLREIRDFLLETLGGSEYE